MSRRVDAVVLEFDPALVKRLCDSTTRAALDEQPELARILRRAMRQAWNTGLTQTQRRYLLLYYQDAMTMREIAAQCGVTVPTVSRTLARARRRLRQVLRCLLPNCE